MARRTVSSTAPCPVAPDQVWAKVSDFCNPWHPAIATMRAEQDERGSIIRAFTVQGETTTYRERLTYLSHTERTMAYTHVAGIAGVDRYDARLVITETAAGGSIISMTATLSAPAARADDIAAGTQAIFDTGVATIANSALNSAPAGANPKDMTEHVPVETQFIDGLPQLAVSVTPARSDTLVLFLHGIGGARENWERQLQAVAPHARAAALDLRGYGDSTLGAAQTTIDDYCADILRVTEVLGARRLVLCGLSYGAWIATSFAMRHPDRLAGLILSGGCTGMSEAGPDEREAFRISREIPLNEGQTPADFAPAVVNVIAGPNAQDNVRGALKKSMSAIPAETYRDALRCFTNPLERFDFSRITTPVLLMTGEHDKLAPPQEIKHVAERIFDAAPHPDVRFEIIADAGHVCNLERPAQYEEHLIAFIRRVVG